MAVKMTTDTVKNAKMTTESVGNFVFFETLTTEKGEENEILTLLGNLLRWRIFQW